MIQKILYILIILSLDSCATLLTRTKYDIKVSSDNLPANIQIADTLYDLPAEFSIKRSKNDLHVKLITESSNKDFTIKSSLTPTFIFGNLLWAELCPVAYLIDLTNQKRYYYGKSIFLNQYDTTTIIEPQFLKSFHNYFNKNYPTYKNQFFLTVSLPWINNFYLQPKSEPVKFNTGFWGISMGLDYFYSDTKFFNLSVSAVSDFFIPVPAAIDIYGEYELMDSFYISYTLNNKIKRFNIGYGLNIASNSWNFKYAPGPGIPPASRDLVTKTASSLGFTTNAYYQIGKHFFVGLIYRPSFLRIDPKFETKYEHLISFDFGWKIKI